MIPTRHVPEVLTRARDLVNPELETALGRLSPQIAPVARYHLGWTDETGAPSNGGGKGVRQALAVLSAEAAGASAKTGVPGAVAVELVHNFSLIHDDVIDEDDERRHRATVWAVFGVGRAIIVGDALTALAQQVLLEVGGTGAALLLADATAQMIAGQALDMSFENEIVVDLRRCSEMEAGKTGALLSCASAIGAMLAGADERVVSALSLFGMELGLSFQAVDDLLGIWGDPATTGKPAWNDLRMRKKTVPVAGVLGMGGRAAAELVELLTAERLGDDEVERAAALIEEAGGRKIATDEADRHLEAALSALGEVDLDDAAVHELTEVARFVVERDF